MKIYSDGELRSIFGLMTNPHFNALCLRITTEPPVQAETIAIEHHQQTSEPSALRETSDAELGRHPE
jgi:hypothetical protein